MIWELSLQVKDTTREPKMEVRSPLCLDFRTVKKSHSHCEKAVGANVINTRLWALSVEFPIGKRNCKRISLAVCRRSHN